MTHPPKLVGKKEIREVILEITGVTLSDDQIYRLARHGRPNRLPVEYFERLPTISREALQAWCLSPDRSRMSAAA